MKASSTWALSAPVWLHCAMKRFLEREATARNTNNDSGIISTVRQASSGEMVNIITMTPMIVSDEVSIWLSVCCRLCATLSMSLVTRLSRSPRAWRSTYDNGSRLSLSSTLARRRIIVRCTTVASRCAWAHASVADTT